MDPLQSLNVAISLPTDSKEQTDILSQLREYLEEQPGSIPILCTTLLGSVVNTPDSAFKRWLLDLLLFALSKSTLASEVKTQLASQCLSSLATLLNDASPNILKITVQCFACVYPLLFRYLCARRDGASMWDGVSLAKKQIISFMELVTIPIGVKLSVVKFMQRVVLVQSRSGSDPRLQNKTDPNLSQCPADHPFLRTTVLEGEGVTILQQLITVLYSSQNPEMITAVINTFGLLIKLRQATLHIIVSALSSWTPVRLGGQPSSVVRSVEKAIRILLVHVSRHGYGAQLQSEINKALVDQQARMEIAAREEHARKVAAAEAIKKRGLPPPVQEDIHAKRAKLEEETAASATASALAQFDFTTLPINLITDLVIANLQAIPQTRLTAAVEAYRQQNPVLPLPVESTAPAPVKEEIVNPLNVELDDDEIEFEPDKLNSALEVDDDLDLPEDDAADDAALIPLRMVEFDLPPPRRLSPDERSAMILSSLNRIQEAGYDMAGTALESDGLQDGSRTQDHPKRITGLSSAEAWMLFIVRMATRGTTPGRLRGEIGSHEDEEDMQVDVKGKGRASEDVIPYGRGLEDTRRILCEHVLDDFASKMQLATLWLNEEWYNDKVQLLLDPNWQPQYDLWLQNVLAGLVENLDSRDKTLSPFLVDLPYIPAQVLSLLREICCNPNRMPAGFMSLRELVQNRPPLRQEAMKILLELTTHPEKVTRGAAIITVRRWVPDQQPMDAITREYALRLLQRLETKPRTTPPKVEPDGDTEMTKAEVYEVESVPTEHVVGSKLEGDPVTSAYLPGAVELPMSKSLVLQHVELLLALSVKVPEFLDEIFAAYGQMDESIQNSIRELIVQLIKSLGPNNGKLLTVLRTFPPAAESLALCVLTILTEHGRPTGPLVSLVKSLIAERNLDARFLIYIIGELEKAEIIRHLPRIVSMLNGKPDERDLVRKVFSNVVTHETPAGTVSSNMPRVKHDQRLNPADLMVLLHEREKEIGLKSAIEAISICFSMTDVFRYDVLAVVMQQIVDEPTLPVLFMRTVIQAVTTYKNLVSFVTTSLFTRLIVKKIWTIPPLWEGFIRCAKVTAPASFGALLSLHKDQLREVVEKQPGLKSGLRDHLIKKAGSKAKSSAQWEVLGDDVPMELAPAMEAS